MEPWVNIVGKVRTDHNYPAGFMDVLELEKSWDRFRLMIDTKWRLVLHRIKRKEVAFKLCHIMKVFISADKILVAVTHNGGIICYPDPDVKVNNTVKIDIVCGKMTGSILKFKVGAMVTLTRGRNAGRIGQLMHVERHEGLSTLWPWKTRKIMFLPSI